MKILYIANSRIPTEKAHGIQIMKTTEAMTKHGAKVELIVPLRENKEFKNTDPFDYYDVERIFKIRKLFSFDPYWLIKLPQGVYIKFQAFFFMMSLFFYFLIHGYTQTRFASEARRVRTQMDTDDIIYTRDEYLLPLLLKFSKRVVWEAHSLPKNRKKYLKYWQKCFKIIAISQGLREGLAKLGVDSNKILTAADGVDLEEYDLRFKIYDLRKKLNIPLDKKIIIYTGHFYDWKGVQTLACAAKLLTDNELVVFVGGDNFYFKKFEQKNCEIKNILFLGPKPPQEILFYLKAADVAVLPNSLKDEKSKWTSPLKMFEYMASGLPIVASDLPSIREVLNQNNAILVKPDDAEELAKGIQTVLQNKKLADKISNWALEDVQNYSWQKRAEKILNFIKNEN